MYRLVIADDEPLVRTRLYCRTDWNAMGFEVVAVVEDGKDVLELMEKDPVDVLLLDICMFQISGLEVAEIVQKKYPDTKVVLLSGYQEFEYARKAMHYHVYEYLLKPIDFQELARIFAKIKEELDEKVREEQLLKSFGEAEYEQVLAVTKNVTGTVLGEKGNAWLMYARLKTYLRDMPEILRKYLIKSLLEQLKISLKERDLALAEAFEHKLSKIDFTIDSGAEKQQDSLIDLLSEINDNLQAAMHTSSKEYVIDDSMVRACKYIENHLGESFTYRDVANYLSISPRHFLRRFSNEIGENFTAYLTSKRLEGAKLLLEEESLDVSDIPEAVGYKDVKYFQQIFKKSEGISMREYRRLCKARLHSEGDTL